MGTQNDSISGISEFANFNKDFGDNISPVTDCCKLALAAIHLIVPPILLHKLSIWDVSKKCYSANSPWDWFDLVSKGGHLVLYIVGKLISLGFRISIL